MPVQLQRVAVQPLPRPCQRRADVVQPLLQPGAPAFEYAKPHIRPGIAEEREVHAEPVVLPRRGAALREQILQPLLAFRSERVHDLRTPAGPRPGVPTLVLAGFLGDQALDEKLLQAWVQRTVGERPKRTK